MTEIKQLIDDLFIFLDNPELNDLVLSDNMLLDLYGILFQIGSQWEYYKLLFEQED